MLTQHTLIYSKQHHLSEQRVDHKLERGAEPPPHHGTLQPVHGTQNNPQQNVWAQCRSLCVLYHTPNRGRSPYCCRLYQRCQTVLFLGWRVLRIESIGFVHADWECGLYRYRVGPLWCGHCGCPSVVDGKNQEVLSRFANDNTIITFVQRNACDRLGWRLDRTGGGGGVVNYVTRPFLVLTFTFFSWYVYQGQQEVWFDEEQQTATDHQVVVVKNLPEDVHNPQLWRDYFQTVATKKEATRTQIKLLVTVKTRDLTEVLLTATRENTSENWN